MELCYQLDDSHAYVQPQNYFSLSMVTACMHTCEVFIINYLLLLVCVCFCVNRVLEALEQTAGAINVTENGVPTLIEGSNVVVEVVVMRRAALKNGLPTTRLRGGNRVMLPQALLFSLRNVTNTIRFNVISINNRNLIPPRAQNNRLRGNIISVTLNVPGGLSNLSNAERIQISFDRVCIAHAALQHVHLIIVCLMS